MGSSKDFEWSRERLLRLKKSETKHDSNRSHFLLEQIQKAHGTKAVKEVIREFNSK